ncbi:MAG TPA: class I SAM-dependent methyltransferase [Candidatus Dormibacteraeota bacterium]
MTTWQSADLAASWKAGAEAREAAMAAATDTLFSLARIRPGLRVLECGCGSGEMAFKLADAVAPGGHVVAVDGSPEMIGVARQSAEGRTDVEFEVADLQQLGKDGSGFEAAVARNVVMLIEDEVAALRAIRAALASGARFACSVWTEAGNPRFVIPLEVLGEMGVDVPAGSPLLMVRRLGSEDRLAGALSAAGFTDIRCLRVTADRKFEAFERLLADEARGPVATQLRRTLGEEATGRVLTAIGERLQQFRRGTGAVLPGRQLVAVGTA